MNATTLFDLWGTPVNTATVNSSRARWARRSDPVTSHEAAERAKPAASELIEAIRSSLGSSNRLVGPITAFQIAAVVELWWPGRWDEGTVRTAISRAGVIAVDTLGRSPRGSRCLRYELGPRS